MTASYTPAMPVGYESSRYPNLVRVLAPEFASLSDAEIRMLMEYRYGRGATEHYEEYFEGIFGDIGNDTTHYTVARLDQTTRSMTTRVSFTATPTLSLQVYAQPFATRGNYTNWLQVNDPRSAQWSDRFRPYDGGDPGAFDFKQYRSNTVVRWEYRPGSVLFLVWAQQRTASLGGDDARAAASGIGQLSKAHPLNVFLIKGSYWLSF